MRVHRFVDLFAGCGGLSLGLSQAGMRGLFAIERDAMAFETFSTNFVDDTSRQQYRFEWPAWLERQAWSIDDVLLKHKGSFEKLRGRVDILAGGPPCQGFSFAGRRVEGDPRNLLFNKYAEMVQALKPAALILENVPGMRVAHRRTNVVELQAGTLPRAESFYEKLAFSLDEAGYDVKAVLIDAAHFGVPQKRLRLIVVGIRKDLAQWLKDGTGHVFDLLEQTRVEQLADLGLAQVVSASEAIGDLEISGRPLLACEDSQSPRGFMETTRRSPNSAYQELMSEGTGLRPNSMRLPRHRDDVRKRFARILLECRKGVRMSDDDRRSYSLKKHRIFPMSPFDPAPTITTLPDDVLHYSEPRILTVRESARLQSFPDWFQFKGKYTTGGDRRTRECPRYTQVGNAVPPYLARAIGKAISSALDEIELARRIYRPDRQRAIAALG